MEKGKIDAPACINPFVTTKRLAARRLLIVYRSDVGRYWYDPARPNRLAQITPDSDAGAIANTGKRALSFVYDDYRPDAKPVNGISLGNGNLMYTVSHDAQTGKHSARFEAYTSFNMPREISYSNIGAEIDPNLATTAATVGYGCMSTVGVLAGANCVASYTETVPALVGSYSCPTGITSTVSGSTCNMVKTVASVKVGIYGGLVIDTCHTGFVLASTGCTQSYSVTATPSSYTCSGVTSTTPAPAGASTSAWTLSGAGASSSCTRTVTYISAASAVYSCPAGQTKLGTGIGSVCRAIIGATPVYACPAGYSAQSAGCVSTATNGASLQAGSVRYFHTDHLGSVTAITDETGLVVERLAYDAWGKRRFTNGTADVNDTVVGLTTDRGYTEHEMLDELGIIHMNGRVYDPYIGRFMSADPFIQAPYELQSHNRYAYVMNNPLLYTDPSGFNWFKKLFIAVVIIVATVYTMGAVAGAMGFGSGMAGIAAATTGATATLGSAMLVGAAGGFVSGFLGGVLNGASFSDSLKAGAVGAITGAAFSAVGNTFAANSFGNYLGHAVVGCVSSVSGGGQCGSGAASAVIGKWATNNTGDWGTVGSGVAAAVAGGVSSAATGGSFVNGARTAAYGYLFNSVATGILEGGFANRPLINWGAIGSSLTGLAARINVFVAAMSLAGDTPKTYYYHYTGERGYSGILSDGIIIPSPDGYVYTTQTVYPTGAEAQRKLALSSEPVGYFKIPASDIIPIAYEGVVQPWNKQPGGGWEIKSPQPVSVKKAIWIRLP